MLTRNPPSASFSEERRWHDDSSSDGFDDGRNAGVSDVAWMAGNHAGHAAGVLGNFGCGDCIVLVDDRAEAKRHAFGEILAQARLAGLRGAGFGVIGV